MAEYRRANVEGATYFFTVNCAERHGNHLLVDNIGLLRKVMRKVKSSHPFNIVAIVILPEHFSVFGGCHLAMQTTKHVGH